MEPVTEITTVLHAHRTLVKGKIINNKIAFINVYQHPFKTHNVINSVEKRILKKRAKLMKNEKVQKIIIFGNLEESTSVNCLKTAGFKETRFRDDSNRLFSNFEEPNRQGTGFDAEEWREICKISRLNEHTFI